MAIDGEPKNGDYARYVERLINRGSPSPGQVLSKADTAPTAPSPGEVLYQKNQKVQKANPGRTMAGDGQAEPARAHPADLARPKAGNDTLAAQAVKRKISIGMTVVALVIAWSAVRMLVTAMNKPHFEMETIIPVAFLLVFAAMLYRGARGLRADARRPPRSLAPLSGMGSQRQDGTKK
jgi:hypothetical protein